MEFLRVNLSFLEFIGIRGVSWSAFGFLGNPLPSESWYVSLIENPCGSVVCVTIPLVFVDATGVTLPEDVWY